VPVAPARGKGVEPQLDLLERVGGAREHRVEHRVDDVSLAPLLRQIGSEHLRERHSLLVKRQQVVHGDHNMDLQGSQAVCAIRRRPRHIGVEREGDGMSVGMERP
jgi:hypothetical protein